MAKNKLNIILGIDARALERSLGQVQHRLNRFASSLQSTGRTLTESLTVPLAGVGAASLAAFGDIEKLEKGMLAITGSADAARREIDLLRKAAEAPGLSFEQAVKGSIQLQAVKFSAEEARETISALGQAVALTGGSAVELESVVRQITQINAKGRILQEDIGIIQENAPAVGIALQEAFGTTSVEAIRNSGISAREFTLRLTEAIQQSETFQGVTGGLSNSFENFRNSVKFALAELGRSINESVNLEGIMNKLSAAIGQAVNFFKSLTPEARRFVIVTAAIVAGIGPLILVLGKIIAIGPVFVGALKNIVSVVRSVGAAFTIANLQIFAIVAVVAIVITALATLYNRFENVRKVVNGTIDFFKEFGNILSDVKDFVGGIARGLAAFFSGRFADAGSIFSEALQADIPSVTEVGARLGAAFAGGFSDGSNRLDGVLDGLKSKIFDTAKEFSGIAPTLTAPGTSGTATGTGTGAAQKIGIADETIINIPIEFDEEAKVQVDEFGLALDRQVKTVKDYQAAINLATQEAKNFGSDGLGLIRAEMDATKSTIDTLLAGPYTLYDDTIKQLSARYQELAAQMQLAEQQQATLQERMQSVTNLVGGALGQAFTDFFTAIETGGKNAFQSLLDGLKNALISIVKQLAVALIKAIAVAAVLSIVFPNSTSVSGAGKAASQLGSLFKSFAGLADGGIIPPGFPNDTFPARLSSGEAVIPLDKLDRYTGGQTVFIPNLTIKGQDFVIAFEKAKASYNRYS